MYHYYKVYFVYTFFPIFNHFLKRVLCAVIPCETSKKWWKFWNRNEINFFIDDPLIISLREKCPNTDFFLVRIQENTDQKKTPYLDTFHAVYFKQPEGSLHPSSQQIFGTLISSKIPLDKWRRLMTSTLKVDGLPLINKWLEMIKMIVFHTLPYLM